MATILTMSVDLHEIKTNQEKIIDLLEQIINKETDIIEKASAKIITDISEVIHNNKESLNQLKNLIEKPKVTTSYKGLTRFSPPNLGSSEPKMESLKNKQVLKYPFGKINEKQDLFNFKGKE